MLRGQTHCRVIGLVGLQNDLAWGVGAARAAGDLGEQLESSLRSAKVREGEALIGERDANQGHRCDVVPLGDHLSAHQHVDFACAQAIEHRLDAITRRRVAIEPCDPSLREALFDRLFELFGPDPDPLVLGAPARRTGNRDGPMKITVVASKRALPTVLGQCDTARWALCDRPTSGTAHARRKATTVEEDDRLMAGLQAFANRGMKRPGKKRVPRRAFSVAAQVDDLDLGHRGACGARRQREQPDSPLVGPMVGLDRRRRAPEHAHRTCVLRPKQRHVASMVAKALVLLERRVVLLVDDDQSQIRDRRKQRGTCPNRDLHSPPSKRLPGVVALTRGETTVKNGDVVAEAGAEPSDELRCERDLRNEQHRATPRSAHFVDRPEVHLRLARTGHAMQKKRLARAL